MQTILNYENYLSYLKDRTESLPKKGRGEPARLSRLLGISTVAMSHVFHGRNLLNLDQAIVLAKDFKFDHFEREYFFKLVELERASTKELRSYLKARLYQIKTKSNDLENIVLKEGKIHPNALAHFYSDWTYSAFRLLSALDEFNSLEDICEYFDISLDKGKEIIDFLIQFNLVKKVNNQLFPGVSSTHLSKDSPFINNHRRNWRLKGLEKLKDLEEDDLFYSSPFAMGEEDIDWLRYKIKELIKELQLKVKDSPCETLVCFNLDLFKF